MMPASVFETLVGHIQDGLSTAQVVFGRPLRSRQPIGSRQRYCFMYAY